MNSNEQALELRTLFTNATNLNAILQHIIEKLFFSLHANACALYLFDDDTKILSLKASKGLGSTSQVNSFKPGEGLVGIAFKEQRVVNQGDFLGVPIVRGQNRIGVITFQSVHQDHFADEDISILHASLLPLVTTIEMAKLLFSFDHPVSNPAIEMEQDSLKFVQGRVGAEGYACGDSVVLMPLTLGDFTLPIGRKSLTINDFRRATAATEKELYEMQMAIEEKLLDVVAFIFSAQIMMLKDQAMIGAMAAMIEQGIQPQDAVRAVVEQYVKRFDQMTNEYVREKKYDVIDVGRRILMNMLRGHNGHDQYASKVIIVRELLPSDVMKLSLQDVAGIVLLSGGVTSHVAILARSLNIPLVLIDELRLLNLKNGAKILLDGYRGNIVIDPDNDAIAIFEKKQLALTDINKMQDGILAQTLTKDGAKITLLANINILADLRVAKAFKAEGVGLYRTEFPFLLRGDFPSEEDQYVIYRRLIDEMKNREITFRTLDIGGDKMLSHFDNSKEANPFLGLRSIRFSLKHLEIFICQVRAILRASVGTEVRIMFPMISSVEEFVTARDLVRTSVHALKLEGKPHQANPMIGAMIEVPSILEVIDELAQEADFMSIGTNDLIQYMLAVDRTNERVADCYLPHHPAVLRGIKRVADAAKRHQRDISVCGDMAHDPRYIPFLIGIGIHKLSLDARYLPKIQQRIIGLDTHQAETFAAQVLGIASTKDTARRLEDEYALYLGTID